MDKDEDKKPIVVQLMPPDYHEYDIWHAVMRYKIHIVLITFTCGLIALIYALLTPQVYQADVYLLPPSASDVVELSIFQQYQLNNLKAEYNPDNSPEKVYEKFLLNFNSHSIRLEFFKSDNLSGEAIKGSDANANLDNVFEEKFDKMLSLDKDRNSNNVIVHLLAAEPKIAADWLNNFIDFVNKKTVEILKKDLIKEILLRKEMLSNEIGRRREFTLLKIKDREIILEEAKDIAEKLKIKKPFQSFSNFSASYDSKVATFESMPLYMKGEDVLSEELETLRNRKNLDPFIDGLRELEKEIDYLESLVNRLNENITINTVIVDRYANVPEHQIKPKRKQIVIIGLFAGLILSILTVFLLNYAKKNA